MKCSGETEWMLWNLFTISLQTNVMVWVCGSVIFCFILKFCHHVSCFAFHFLPCLFFLLFLLLTYVLLVDRPCMFKSSSSTLSFSVHLFCLPVSPSCHVFTSFGSWFLSLFLVCTFLFRIVLCFFSWVSPVFFCLLLPHFWDLLHLDLDVNKACLLLSHMPVGVSAFWVPFV